MRRWMEGSNCLVLLNVPDEDALVDHLDVIWDANVAHSAVTEPDLDNEHTAVAIGPSNLGASLSHLPLLGRMLAAP